MVQGLDKARQATQNRTGRSWLKLEEGKPTEVTILSYEGEVESKFKNDSGNPRLNYRWLVRHEEREKNLDGSWRMHKAITDALKDNDADEVEVTITRKQTIEEIKNKDGSVRKAIVNIFEVVPF